MRRLINWFILLSMYMFVGTLMTAEYITSGTNKKRSNADNSSGHIDLTAGMTTIYEV